ncbi:MAG: zinc-dependent metalloprotease [Ilumatobacteraceae bacterium]
MGATHAGGLPPAVHRARRVVGSPWRRRRHAGPARSDDGDDGRSEPDDGAGDDGHVDRIDGGTTRHEGVRPVRPAGAAHSSSVLVVARTVDQFADEWSLPLDEMRLWVLAQELIGHSVYSHTPTREAIISLVQRHVGAFRADPSSVSEKLADLDLGTDGDPMVAIQQAFSDPEVLLGAVRSPEQVALAPVLDAATAAVVGYVDYMVDSVAARLIGGDALRIAEAVRRRRIEAGAEDVFIERLLGLQVTPAMVQRGKNFVAGVVDRAGEAALASLFATDSSLPTPAELEAPGLWLARIEL